MLPTSESERYRGRTERTLVDLDDTGLEFGREPVEPDQLRSVVNMTASGGVE